MAQVYGTDVGNWGTAMDRSDIWHFFKTFCVETHRIRHPHDDMEMLSTACPYSDIMTHKNYILEVIQKDDLTAEEGLKKFWMMCRHFLAEMGEIGTEPTPIPPRITNNDVRTIIELCATDLREALVNPEW